MQLLLLPGRAAISGAPASPPLLPGSAQAKQAGGQVKGVCVIIQRRRVHTRQGRGGQGSGGGQAAGRPLVLAQLVLLRWHWLAARQRTL